MMRRAWQAFVRAAARVMVFVTGVAFVLLSVTVAQSVTSGRLKAQSTYSFKFATHPADSAGLAVIEFEAPPQYESWWAEIAACQRLPLSPKYRDVRYFVANVREYYTDKWAIATTIAHKNEMFFAFPYVVDKAIFMHEALHFLMHWAREKPDPAINKDVDHPEYRYGTRYVGKCGVFPYRRDSVDYR